MRDIAIIVPTKGRPDKLAELIASFNANKSEGHSSLIPIVDAAEYEDYKFCGLPVRLIDGYLVQKLNEGAKLALGWDFEYIGWLGDDVVIQTPEFDRLIVEAFEAEPHIKIIHCADKLHNGKIANHWIMRADVVQKLGWFIPPTFKHLWIDNFITKLGTDTNTIKYLDSVLLEHRHFINHKAAMDDTYRLSNTDDAFKHGEKAFNDITTGEAWNNLLEMYNSI